MDIKQYDDIRPYNDDEINEAMQRISSNRFFSNISAYLFPGKDEAFFKKILLNCHTVNDFQVKVMSFIVRKIIADTAKEMSFGGLDNFEEGKKYLLISNHRDIVLDSAIIQLILHENKIPTTEISVGDNLITSPFIEDITRSNKMIKVIRSSSAREVYFTSQRLSNYIRNNISGGRSSIWIAQRNGRTKDGLDITEQGLLKMLSMSGSGDFLKDFEELNIMPVTVSYEFEPCDILKAIELHISKRQKYIKTRHEDLNSILTGIMQFKGGIHIQFNQPLATQEINLAANSNSADKNEKFKLLGEIMDKKIVSNYHLWKNNYIAYDLLHNSEKYSCMYTEEEKLSFENYTKYKLSTVEDDKDDVEKIFLGIYANPLISKENISK
jgi:hypothetical protein